MRKGNYLEFRIYINPQKYPDVVEVLKECPKGARGDMVARGIKLLIKAGFVSLPDKKETENPSVKEQNTKSFKISEEINLEKIFE